MLFIEGGTSSVVEVFLEEENKLKTVFATLFNELGLLELGFVGNYFLFDFLFESSNVRMGLCSDI